MGDTLKLYKGTRHKSSSSLSSFIIEATKSEKKFGLKGSIPEIEDKFAIAEERCNDLKDKIEMVKEFKRKRKLKKRSVTRVFPDNVSEGDEIPFMKVHTKPKKKLSQRNARLRVANPVRSSIDSAIRDQHKIFQNTEEIHGGNLIQKMREAFSQTKVKRKTEDNFNLQSDNIPFINTEVINKQQSNRKKSSKKQFYFNNTTRENFAFNNEENVIHVKRDEKQPIQNSEKSSQKKNKPKRQIASPVEQYITSKPEVELLFNKEENCDDHVQNRGYHVQDDLLTESSMKGDIYINDKKSSKSDKSSPRLRKRHRCRRYELPTISSQMKQTGMRYYMTSTNYTNIPFVATKSITPSHNIGVNIQQVLNGMKIQQPLSGIPLSIAHHMGLRHIPKTNYNSKSAEPTLDIHEVNAIKLGKNYLMLPTHKYLISYHRLLNMYRQGDGMVPRFLRAISKPHYFYTSMYNLNANRGDFDGATSKARYSQEVRQSLAEYAALYREYEILNKKLKDGENNTETETRKNDISIELAAREPHIRQVMQEYKISPGQDSLRASASLADEEYRRSNFRLVY